MSEVFRDDRQVEMYLRSLLGISQQRDIKEAWIEWAKRNHPDKGGSVDKFIITKSAYEEWYESNR
jgi:DnaJ-class molecular chaperone